MSEIIEYRVRPVARYIVTRYKNERHGDGREQAGASTTHGEFDNFDTAYAVGYALAKAEHERLGWALDDERIKYPDPTDPAVRHVGGSLTGSRPVVSTLPA